MALPVFIALFCIIKYVGEDLANRSKLAELAEKYEGAALAENYEDATNESDLEELGIVDIRAKKKRQQMLLKEEKMLAYMLLGAPHAPTVLSAIIGKLSYFFNAALINSIAYKLLRLKTLGERKKAEINPTIVGLLVGRKARQNAAAYLSLFAALVIYLGSSCLLRLEIWAAPVVAICFLLFAVYANQKLLEFRVEYGLYGTNEAEAREFINFLLSHSKKTDFTDSDGSRKRLLPDPKELEGMAVEPFGQEGEATA